MKQEIYGHLSLDTMATHIPHKFIVPEGTNTLRLEFTHTPEHPGVGNIPPVSYTHLTLPTKA